ncbi:MAG: hypothetical protein SV422_00290 [Pseudomonadota bacterium]|nr:hypothetical protein [Pseudomonadota bacterium]
MSLQNISIPDDAIAALENGNKVEAARIIRDESWITLKQASNAADAFLEANPDVKARYLDQLDKNWNGFVYFVALLSVAAIIANLFQ